MTDEHAFEMDKSIDPTQLPFELNERSSSVQLNSWQLAGSLDRPGGPSGSSGFEWQMLDLAQLWHALCAGTWRFQEVFDSDSRCYAVIEPARAAKARPLRDRCLDILGRLLTGQSHKEVAFDLEVARSTVASAAQQGLLTMGLKRQGSRAPMLLAMAANAALRPRRVPVLARCTRVGTDEGGSLLVSVERPDALLPAQLSLAEASVLRLLLSGATHAQIARQRATSCRTVANQLASTFRKLGVSGRGALTAHLISLASGFRDDQRDLALGSDGGPASKGFSQSSVRGACT
ncbi:MAG: helix-turn-helix transcriptional regulator [Myxococcales bacterium]